MGASLAQIDRLRRLVNEPYNSSTYDDLLLTEMLEAHPLPDSDGRAPDDEEWDSTSLDVWAAAADIWAEKAAALAGEFDFGADGANYSRSQAYEHARKQAAFCASRRAARGVRLRGITTAE